MKRFKDESGANDHCIFDTSANVERNKSEIVDLLNAMSEEAKSLKGKLGKVQDIAYADHDGDLLGEVVSDIKQVL